MSNVDELVKKYRFDRGLRKFSGNRNNHTLHAKINNREDISSYYRGAERVYEQLSKNYNLVEEDVDWLKSAIADYEVCVNKVIQMMDSPIKHPNWTYTFEELNEFIDNLQDLYDKADKIIQRRLYQD